MLSQCIPLLRGLTEVCIVMLSAESFGILSYLTCAAFLPNHYAGVNAFNFMLDVITLLQVLVRFLGLVPLRSEDTLLYKYIRRRVSYDSSTKLLHTAKIPCKHRSHIVPIVAERRTDIHKLLTVHIMLYFAVS